MPEHDDTYTAAASAEGLPVYSGFQGAGHASSPASSQREKNKLDHRGSLIPNTLTTNPVFSLLV